MPYIFACSASDVLRQLHNLPLAVPPNVAENVLRIEFPTYVLQKSNNENNNVEINTKIQNKQSEKTNLNFQENENENNLKKASKYVSTLTNRIVVKSGPKNPQMGSNSKFIFEKPSPSPSLPKLKNLITNIDENYDFYDTGENEKMKKERERLNDRIKEVEKEVAVVEYPSDNENENENEDFRGFVSLHRPEKVFESKLSNLKTFKNNDEIYENKIKHDDENRNENEFENEGKIIIENGNEIDDSRKCEKIEFSVVTGIVLEIDENTECGLWVENSKIERTDEKKKIGTEVEKEVEVEGKDKKLDNENVEIRKQENNNFNNNNNNNNNNDNNSCHESKAKVTEIKGDMDKNTILSIPRTSSMSSFSYNYNPIPKFFEEDLTIPISRKKNMNSNNSSNNNLMSSLNSIDSNLNNVLDIHNINKISHVVNDNTDNNNFNSKINLNTNLSEFVDINYKLNNQINKMNEIDIGNDKNDSNEFNLQFMAFPLEKSKNKKSSKRKDETDTKIRKSRSLNDFCFVDKADSNTKKSQTRNLSTSGSVKITKKIETPCVDDQIYSKSPSSFDLRNLNEVNNNGNIQNVYLSSSCGNMASYQMPSFFDKNNLGGSRDSSDYGNGHDSNSNHSSANNSYRKSNILLHSPRPSYAYELNAVRSQPKLPLTNSVSPPPVCPKPNTR